MASIIYSIAERMQESDLAAKASKKVTRLRRSRSRFRSFDKMLKGSWGLSQKSDQTATSPDDSSDVTLVAFSPRQQSTRYKTRPTSLSRNSKSTQDITYSINGQVCTPSSEIVPSVVGNKVVTLVGFSPRNTSFKQPSGVRRSESFAPSSEKTKKKQNYKRDVDLDDEDQESSTGASTYYSPYCTNTLKTSKELKMERERLRQEKLSHFARDAQNWRRQAETSESKTSKSFDSGSNGFDDPFFAAFDKMMGSGAGSKTDDFMKFFQEAEKRFTTAGFKSRDAGFGKFFQENRERFNQMKEEMRKRREENVLKMSDFDDFFSKVTTDWKKSDPFFDAEEKSKSEWSPKDGYYDPPGAEDTTSTTRNESFRRSFSSSSGFDSCSEASGPKYNPRHTHFGGTFDFGSPEPLFRDRGGGFAPKFTTTFNGFTRFTPIIVSPPGNNRVVAGKMGYKMKTHRSTFEYDGNTNTYRFSTEQVTHSFNGDGSAVSESEESDDEDEDPPRNKQSTLAALPSSTNVPHLQSSSTTAAKNASALLPSSSPAPLEKPCPSPAGGDAMAGSPVGGCQGDTLSVAAPSELDSCTEGGNSPNNSVAALEYSDPSQDKSHNIAMELLTTEKTYVDVLHLIDQVFYARVEEENEVKQMFPPEVLPQIFANVRSLYKFHHDFLLPKLKERMENWETDPRIGDIMKDFAPFLKMYAEYVKNFDHAMNLINVLVGKNPRFAAIVEEIQQMPECGNLTLQHHMLSPIQRLPRYQLLLQDYLRRLPDNSSDRDHTERALHLVSVAAMHANDAMRKMDQFKQLLEIQDRLGGVSTIDLVSPSRALVREGKVTKISARSGDHQERYLFLFTDLVLLCSTRPRLPVGSVAQYRLRAQFPMAGLQVLEGDNLETPNTFYLSDGQRTIELYTSSVEEKEAWVTSFVEVIQDLCLHKSSLRLDDSSTTAMGNGHNDDDSGDGSANGALVTSDESSGVGMNPPSLLRMDGVGKCMDCGASFTFKRKHHCHACGIIVCSKCSNQKAILKYNNSKESRICKECYRKLRNASLLTNSDGNGSLSDGKMLASNGSTSTLTNGRDGYGIDGDYAALGRERVMLMGPRLLDVPANSPCTVNGYLNLKSVRGKTWAKRWFVLHAEGVLFSYKLPSDDRALTATPVPGYSLTHGHGLKGDPMVNEKERDLTFKMHCANKAYYFQAETKGDLLRWITELEECVRNNTTTN